MTERENQANADAAAAAIQTIEIRQAAASDEPFLRLLTRGSFGHLGPYEEWVVSWLHDPRVGCYVAEAAGQAVGFFMLVVGFSPASDRLVGDLLVIAVAPEQRRRGLGRALLDEAIAICAQADSSASERWFELSVAADNRAARQLFLQAGLTPVDVPTSSYPNGQRSIRMRRVL